MKRITGAGLLIVEVSVGYDPACEFAIIDEVPDTTGKRTPVSFSRDGGETWAVIGECDVKSIEWDIECPLGVFVCGAGRGGGGKKVLLATGMMSSGMMDLSLAAHMPVLVESRSKGKGRKAHKKLKRKMGGGW